jgi:nucleoside recognition membrane protein YjiH
MPDQDTTTKPDISDTGAQLFHLANRVIGLISSVITLLAVLLGSMLVFYGILLLQPHEGAVGASLQMRELIVSLWNQITPYVARFVSLIAPIFVLIFALGVLHRLGKEGASPFDTSKLLSDLPSVLALLIITTICLLPLAGLAVPDILNNIALVVVGFYFGKRKTSNDNG